MTGQNHKIIFHVDMDAFFASCEEALNPALKLKPLVVGGTKEDKRGIVSCPNYLARAKGVRTAMPLTRALLLVPEGNFIRSTRGLYSDYSKRVRDIFYKYTPIVQPVSVDEAYLDVTGVLHLHNNDYQLLADKLRNEIKNTLKITCSVGIAVNKICAKIASKINKPDGVTVVPFGKEREFLSNMTIDKIPGVGKAAQLKLKKYGIEFIGDILKFDQSFYDKEIKFHTSFLLNVANGKGSDNVKENDEIRKSLSKENTFYEDISDREFLLSELYYLMEKCCQKLRKVKLRSRSITVKVKYFDFKVNQRSYTAAKYSNLETDFYEDATLLLDKMLKNKKKIRLLGVKFSEFVTGDEAVQESIFDDYDKKENLLNKLDTIRKKYDFDIVKFGRTIKLK
ncbi:MAG TPA: DNA polymerase IV [Ignavibacteria bacterium]|nr:DNA polymerase IV [Bacteroidota bacterium]HRI85277.1 DNA polymerase IV [Ignavibacteria bacterium]HRK00623.1 DNA polymerase IV [Ignavibacteria bacterium]